MTRSQLVDEEGTRPGRGEPSERARRLAEFLSVGDRIEIQGHVLEKVLVTWHCMGAKGEMSYALEPAAVIVFDGVALWDPRQIVLTGSMPSAPCGDVLVDWVSAQRVHRQCVPRVALRTYDLPVASVGDGFLTQTDAFEDAARTVLSEKERL